MSRVDRSTYDPREAAGLFGYVSFSKKNRDAGGKVISVTNYEAPRAVPKRNLEKALAARRIAHADLAEAFGWKRTSAHKIREWIDGDAHMNDRNVIVAADALDVSPLYLLDLSFDEWPTQEERELMTRFSHSIQDVREGINADLRIVQGTDCEELCSRIAARRYYADHENMASRSVLTYSGGAVSFPIEDEQSQGRVMEAKEVRLVVADRLRELRGDFRDPDLFAQEAISYHLGKCRETRGAHMSLLYALFDAIRECGDQ